VIDAPLVKTAGTDQTSFTDTQMLPPWPWLIPMSPAIQPWLTRAPYAMVYSLE